MQQNRARPGLVTLWLIAFVVLDAPPTFPQPTVEKNPTTTNPRTERAASAVESNPHTTLAEALDTFVDYQFPDDSLTHVAHSVSQSIRVPVVVRQAAIEAAGMHPDDIRVSIVVSGTSLRSFLKTLTESHQLTAVATEEAILITTPDDAARIHFTKTYDLPALPEAFNAQWLVQLVQASILPGSWGASGTGQTSPSYAYLNDDIAYFPTPEASPPPRQQPPRPYPKGGIEVLGKRLIVTHSQTAHHQIQDLLSELQNSFDQAPELAASPVEAALQTPIDLDVVEVPLPEFLKILHEKTGQNIITKTGAASSEISDRKNSVTLIARQISPAVALELTLEQFGMNYQTTNELILIDSSLNVHAQRVTKIYRIPDRLNSYSPEQLAQVITKCIEPESWQAGQNNPHTDFYAASTRAGIMRQIPGHLIITHNPPTQRKIASLLRKL